MVHAFLSLSRERLSLAMKGHAGAGAHGSDLVCAACSVLAATLREMVANGVKNNAFYGEPILHLSGGDALISCAPRADFYLEFLHAYYMAHVGLSLLSAEYPEHVRTELCEGE